MIVCISCKSENIDEAKFCINCGSSTLKQCSVCSLSFSGNANFCYQCGNKLVNAAKEPEKRKKTSSESTTESAPSVSAPVNTNTKKMKKSIGEPDFKVKVNIIYGEKMSAVATDNGGGWRVLQLYKSDNYEAILNRILSIYFPEDKQTKLGPITNYRIYLLDFKKDTINKSKFVDLEHYMESNGLTTLKTFFYIQLWRKFDGLFSNAAARYHETNADGCYDPAAPESLKAQTHAQDATISTTTSTPDTTNETRPKPDKAKKSPSTGMKETVCVYQNPKETTPNKTSSSPISVIDKTNETPAALLTLPITLVKNKNTNSVIDENSTQNRPVKPKPNSSRNDSKSRDSVVKTCGGDSAKIVASSSTNVGSTESVKAEKENPKKSVQYSQSYEDNGGEKQKLDYYDRESSGSYYNRGYNYNHRYYSTKSDAYYNNRGHSRHYEGYGRNYFESNTLHDDKNYLSFERTSYSNSYIRGRGSYNGSRNYNNNWDETNYQRSSNYHHRNNSYYNRYDDQRSDSARDGDEKAQQSGSGSSEVPKKTLMSSVKIENVDDDVIIDDAAQGDKLAKRSSAAKTFDGGDGKRNSAAKSTARKNTIVEKLLQNNSQEEDSDEEKKNMKIKTVKDFKSGNMQLVNDRYNTY